MANEIVNLKPLQTPGEVLYPQVDGSKYEEYKADGVYAHPLLPNGRPNRKHVKITYNHGDVFEGELKRGKQFGKGTYDWEDGGRYEGNFKGGKLMGSGTYTAANSDVFEGNFKNNKYDGEGKYTWADGSSFEGTFKDGQLVNGRYTDTSGNVYSCRYKYKRNGERVSGDIRLIKFGTSEKEHEEKNETKAVVSKSSATASKNGLLNKDELVIRHIKKSAQSAEFKNLYTGSAGKSERSERRLMHILNFFTNSDAAQMQRIFKSSKLYDATKGQEHITDMINGVIKRSKDFSNGLKASTQTKQKATTVAKGAAR